VAQLVNNLHSLFLADGDRFVATPTYHVYTMYRPHHGAQSVRTVVEAPDVSFRTAGAERRLFRLAGSASRSGDKVATLTLVHTHASEPVDVVLRLRGATATQVRHTLLTHARLNAHNTFAEPGTVVPRRAELAARGAELRCTLPPASINRLDFDLS
jgi:alpha-L-arabinofuranosidase